MSEGIDALTSSEHPVLVMAPHLDDAVLSAYALLARNGPVDVAVVFSGAPTPPRQTPWDRLCAFADSTAAMAARRDENEQALAGLVLGQHFLGLLDGQYLDGGRSTADRDRIREFALGWLSSHGRHALVAVPAGAGRPPAAGGGVLGAPRSARRQSIRAMVGPWGRAVLRARAKVTAPRTPPFAHPDHLFVRDALTSTPVVDPASLVLYEDLPYSWGAPADDEVAALGRRLDVTPEPGMVAVDREAKARSVAAYRSQLRYMYAPQGPLATAAGLPATERFWLLRESPGSVSPPGRSPRRPPSES